MADNTSIDGDSAAATTATADAIRMALQSAQPKSIAEIRAAIANAARAQGRYVGEVWYGEIKREISIGGAGVTISGRSFNLSPSTALGEITSFTIPEIAIEVAKPGLAAEASLDFGTWDTGFSLSSSIAEVGNLKAKLTPSNGKIDVDVTFDIPLPGGNKAAVGYRFSVMSLAQAKVTVHAQALENLGKRNIPDAVGSDILNRVDSLVEQNYPAGKQIDLDAYLSIQEAIYRNNGNPDLPLGGIPVHSTTDSNGNLETGANATRYVIKAGSEYVVRQIANNPNDPAVCQISGRYTAEGQLTSVLTTRYNVVGNVFGGMRMVGVDANGVTQTYYSNNRPLSPEQATDLIYRAQQWIEQPSGSSIPFPSNPVRLGELGSDSGLWAFASDLFPTEVANTDSGGWSPPVTQWQEALEGDGGEIFGQGRDATGISFVTTNDNAYRLYLDGTWSKAAKISDGTYLLTTSENRTNPLVLTGLMRPPAFDGDGRLIIEAPGTGLCAVNLSTETVSCEGLFPISAASGGGTAFDLANNRAIVIEGRTISFEAIASAVPTGNGGVEISLRDGKPGYVLDRNGTVIESFTRESDYTTYQSSDNLTSRTVWSGGIEAIEYRGADPYHAAVLNGVEQRHYDSGRMTVKIGSGPELDLGTSAGGIRMVDPATGNTLILPMGQVDWDNLAAYYQATLAGGNVPAGTPLEAVDIIASLAGDNGVSASLEETLRQAKGGAQTAILPDTSVPASYATWLENRVKETGGDAKATARSVQSLQSNPAVIAIYDSAMAFASISGALARPSTASVLLALNATVKAAVSLGMTLDRAFLDNVAADLGIVSDAGSGTAAAKASGLLTRGEKLDQYVIKGAATLTALASIAGAIQDPSIRSVAGAVYAAVQAGMVLDPSFTVAAAKGLGWEGGQGLAGQQLESAASEFMKPLMDGAGVALSVISAIENPTAANVAAAGVYVANYAVTQAGAAGLGQALFPTAQAVASAIGFVENPTPANGAATALWTVAAYNAGNPVGWVAAAAAVVVQVFGGGGKPIVLDMDGNGVSLVPVSSSNAYYDLDGDRWVEHRGWIGAGDGLLAFDANGDNIIAGRDELSFTGYRENARTDLEGLIAFDSNHDGKLSSNDAEWGGFRVWMDDGDGVTEAGELRTLDQAGIASIQLASDGIQRDVNGNTIFGQGVFTRTDGTKGVFADAALGAEASLVHSKPGDDAYGGPLVLNLIGDRVSTVDRVDLNVSFDMDGDGDADRTGWIAPDQGFLVVDDNHDAAINGAAEMVGSFADLIAFDSNHDGKVDSTDAAWKELKVWVDKNLDGKSQRNELYSLAQLGIASIATAAVDAERYDNGNVITAEGTFTFTDGDVSQIAEIRFTSGDDGTGSAIFAGDGITTFRLADGQTLQTVAGGQSLEIGRSGVDIVTATGGGNILKAGVAASVVMISEGGGDVLMGGSGETTMVSKGAANTLVGGSGRDIASYVDAGTGVSVNLNTGTAARDGVSDTLQGIDVVQGSAFADTLVGGAGGDTFVGGAGADYLNGGAGSDTASYETSAVGVTIDLVAGTASGGDADGDRLSAIENVVGSVHQDILTGNGGSNVLDGGAGADTLRGNDGDDTLVGGAGADLLDGGTGRDTASYAASTAAVEVNLANGTGTGGDAEGDRLTAIEAVVGTRFDDRLTGDASSNHLVGGDGDDVIDGGDGIDTLDGGAGIDTLTYATSSSGQIVDLAAGTNSSGDTFAGFEILNGSNFADTLTGDAADNLIAGLDGSDTVYGGDGNDTLDGGAGNDTLRGQDGNDTLIGGPGANSLDGGGGNDTASFANAIGGVTVRLDNGTATKIDGSIDSLTSIENVQGSVFSDFVYGNSEANTLNGGDGDDYLSGGAGDDTLIGGAGLNTLVGGSGHDVYIVTSQTDNIIGGSDDEIRTSLSSYSISASVSVDVLTYTGDSDFTGTIGSNNYNNTITGGSGNDRLTSNSSGADSLYGGAGDDTFFGYRGADLFDGGEGIDTVTFGSTPVSLGGGGISVNLVSGVGSSGDAEGDRLISIENVFATKYDDVVIGSNVANVLYGGGGADYLDGGAGIDTASYTNSSVAVKINLLAGTAAGGEADGDRLVSIENLKGSVFNDVFVGDSGVNLLFGWGGNDTLEGGAGADTLDGDAGVDTVQYTASAAGVSVNLATGTAAGGDAEGDRLIAIENVAGSSYDDVLVGSSGANVLLGGAGNDTLNGGLGVDTLSGGAGDDVYLLGDSDQILENAGEGTDTVVTTVSSYVLGANVENLTYSGTANFTATGNSLANTIVGGVGNDILAGLGGADVLDGGAGIDTANYASSAAGVAIDLSAGTTAGGDADGDRLISIENLKGSNYDDVLVGGAGANSLFGGAGNDTLDGGTGADTLSGSTGNDVYVVDDALDQVLENANEGTDLVRTTRSSYTLGANVENLTYSGATNFAGVGNSLANTIVGGVGNDTLAGLGGADVLNGGAGSDTASYANSSVAVKVDLSVGTGVGGDAEGDKLVAIENLTGSSYNDVLIGDSGVNLLSGGFGNDTLQGGAGADTLDGGLSIDTVQYSTSGAGVSVNLATGVGAGGDADGDRLIAIENLAGSDYDDVLVGDGGANSLFGGAGNDTLDGGTGADTLSGGVGDDVYLLADSDQILENAGEGTDKVITTVSSYVLGTNVENLTYSGTVNFTGTGNSLANTIVGGSGNDTLTGLGGSDVLDGGAGIDTANYTGSVAGVAIDLSAGTAAGGDADGDRLVSIENLKGSNYDDVLVGSAGANSLFGGAGNDTLDGGTGADTLSGSTGNDVYVVDDALDQVLENANEGTDLVRTTRSSYTLGANVENLTYSGATNFAGVGNSLANTIVGGVGNDTLTGSGGADFLDGGVGNDTASYAGSSVAVTVDLLAGTAAGGEADGDRLVSIENLTGSTFNDVLVGDNGVNLLFGGGNNDTLEGGAGADTLDGGVGLDTVRYTGSLAGVSVNLATGVGAGGDADGDRLIAIENVSGSNYDDVLVGSSAANSLLGGVGNDTLDGGTGADTLSGGAGDDVYVVDDAFDQVLEIANEGTDLVRTTRSSYTVGVNVENLTYSGAANFSGIGNNLVNTIVSGVGNDTLAGLGGADVLDGGAGIDTADYMASTAAVSVNLLTGTGVGGDAEGDQLVAIEHLRGSSYDDVLTGNQMANSLTGGGGNDTLVGGAGNDVLIGGTGMDVAVFSGSSAGYTIIRGGVAAATVTSSLEGIDNLSEIEVLRFSDRDIFIDGRNNGPVALAKIVGAVEDTLVAITTTTLLAGATDFDGDTLTLASVSNAVNGSVALDASGKVMFTPTANFNGAARFDYTVIDGKGGFDTRTVAVNVAAVNDGPMAQAKSVAAVEDTALIVSAAELLSGATDVDGDALTLSGVGNAVGGTVTLGVDGNVVFSPAPDFNGAARFDYIVSDGNGGTATKTVTVNVAALNDAPVVQAHTVAGTEDQVLTILAVDLLGGAMDVDGDTLSVASVTNAFGGSVVLDSNGNVVFAPDADFNGAARFDYTVTDGKGGSATRTVAVNVAAVNDGPVAQAKSVAAVEDTALIISAAELLSEATDVDGDALTLSGVGNAVGGTVTLGTDGNVVFSPAPDVHGAASFDYTVSDGNGGFDTRTVAVNVAAVNDGPVAQAKSAAAVEDTALIISAAELLSGATDVDGDTLTLSSVGNAVGGTVTLDASGNAAFTPDADFSGAASFDYTISDGRGGSATRTVAVNVAAVNDGPVAQAKNVAAVEDTVLIISAGELLSGATDVDGDTLTLSSVGNAVGGVVTLGADGNVVFSPAPDFHGAASFDYTVSDGNGGLATKTVTITVAAANDAPVAETKVLSAVEDTVLTILASDLLAGATDIDGDALTLSAVGNAVGGIVAQDGDGNVVFTRDADFHRHASFVYTVTDGRGGFDTRTVTFNQVPVASADATIAGVEDQAVTILAVDLLANDSDVDGDALTLSAVANAVGGSVALDAAGDVVFTPFADFSGAASFDYTVSDGHGGFATRTVAVAVAAVNDAPVAQAKTVFAVEDQAVTLLAADLLAGASDIDGGSLTLSSVGNAVGGTVALDASGNAVFTPVTDFHGAASFDYTIADGQGGFATRTVAVAVAAVNDAPVAQAKTMAASEDTPLILTAAELLVGASDADGDALTLSAVGNAVGGSVALSVHGDVVFTPVTNFHGTASFEYTVSDGHGGMATRAVTINVAAVNDAPVIQADVVTGVQNHAVAILAADLLNHASDVDGDILMLTGVGNAVGGGVALDASGNVIFTPTSGFSGVATFEVTISDGFQNVSQTVTVNVAPSILQGGGGDDALSMSDYGFTLLGGGGNDFLAVEGSDNVLYGGSGSDYFHLTGDGSSLLGGEGDDNLNAEGSGNFLDGGMGGDYFHLTGDSSSLLGGDGNDSLNVEGSGNLLDGGRGNDYFRLIGSGSSLLGGDEDDYLYAEGSGNLLDAGWGRDYLYLMGSASSLLGGEGNDYMAAEGSGNLLDAGTGDDYLNLTGGGSSLLGGDGNDYVAAEGSGNLLDAGTGDDYLHLSGDGSSLLGGDGRDYVAAEGSGNLLDAGTGDDYVHLTGDGSTLLGGDGNDYVAAEGSGNLLDAGAGDDYVHLTGGGSTLLGGDGNDYVAVEGSGNLLSGGAGADVYQVSEGDNHIDNRGCAGEADKVVFVSDVRADQLWFSQTGNYLTINVIGTDTTVVVDDWYVSNSNHVDLFETADGSILTDAAVQNLVSAMAGMAPPSLGQTALTSEQHQQLDPVIAANWAPGINLVH